MTATWTAPRTWADNDLVSASDLNEQLRDNLEVLKDPATDCYDVDEASNYTTSSTSFVDVDSTNLALTVESNGGPLMVAFHGTYSNSAGSRVHFDVELDGQRVAGDDGLTESSDTGYNHVSFTVLLNDVSAGSHTLKLQWKSNGGSATLYAGAGTTYDDVHPQFWVREVS